MATSRLRKARNAALAKIKRARERREAALKRGDKRQAASALRVIRRYRKVAADALRRLRRSRGVSGVSAEGVQLIKSFEGFRSKPYRDAVGVWTIGYGHTAGVGPRTRPISERQAAELLRQDLNRHYFPAVKALPTFRHLSQRQVDALVSFVYNVGPGGIAPSTGIGKALRSKNWRRAADELPKWNKAGGRPLAGLTRRRLEERRLFLRGT